MGKWSVWVCKGQAGGAWGVGRGACVCRPKAGHGKAAAAYRCRCVTDASAAATLLVRLAHLHPTHIQV